MIEITGEMRHIVLNEIDVEELKIELDELFLSQDIFPDDNPATYRLHKLLWERKNDSK